MRHDESRMIEKLIELSKIVSAPFSQNLIWEKEEQKADNQRNQDNTPTIEIISLTGSREEELRLIENEVKK